MEKGRRRRKKIFNWTFFMTVSLLGASALAYTVHYLIFRDAHHIFIYMVGDLGFLFLDVLLVVLLLEKLLNRREKKALLSKLNIVIGTFYSEVGLALLKRIEGFVKNWPELEKEADPDVGWTRKDFKKAMKTALEFPYDIEISIGSLVELRTFLVEKRSYLVRMLENPNLFEHDRFTDLLWAVFHISEELNYRGDDIMNLPETDYLHLASDLRRAYSRLTVQWLQYMQHLNENYPFLFSLAARINPMDPSASPIVK